MLKSLIKIRYYLLENWNFFNVYVNYLVNNFIKYKFNILMRIFSDLIIGLNQPLRLKIYLLGFFSFIGYFIFIKLNVEGKVEKKFYEIEYNNRVLKMFGLRKLIANSFKFKRIDEWLNLKIIKRNYVTRTSMKMVLDNKNLKDIAEELGINIKGKEIKNVINFYKIVESHPETIRIEKIIINNKEIMKFDIYGISLQERERLKFEKIGYISRMKKDGNDYIPEIGVTVRIEKNLFKKLLESGIIQENNYSKTKWMTKKRMKELSEKYVKKEVGEEVETFDLSKKKYIKQKITKDEGYKEFNNNNEIIEHIEVMEGIKIENIVWITKD